MNEMEDIKSIVHLRIENFLAGVAKKTTKEIDRKRSEFAARGTHSSGMAVNALKDVEVQGAKDVAEAMVLFYKESLFETGIRLERDEEVEFILRHLELVMNRMEAETQTRVEGWSKNLGGANPWAEHVRQEFREIRSQWKRTLEADLLSAKLRAKQDAKQAALAAEAVANPSGDLIDPKDIARVRSERIRELLIELNKNVREQCPHGAGALMRAVTANAIRQYFIEQGNASQLKKSLPQLLEQFCSLPELPSTIKEAAVHLKANAKILGDLAMHSDDMILTMTDVINCGLTFKAVVQWTISRPPKANGGFRPLGEVMAEIKNDVHQGDSK